MFKILSSLKVGSAEQNGLATIVGGSSDDSPQMEATKKQAYEVTDIYPFMQYMVYKVKAADSTDVGQFCKDHALDAAVFVNLNGGKDKVQLAPGTKVVIPHYSATQDKCEELDVDYLREFELERRLMHDPYLPIFYLYYATVHGDILGYVLMTDCEVIFTPLNEKFKGTYSYEFGNINENHKAGFTISFEDVVGEPFKISIPTEHAFEAEDALTYDIKLGLRQTGNL